MKYFMIEGTFRDPLPVSPEELQGVIEGHHRFLQAGFDEGWVLLSGPKAAGGGGVVLLRSDSLAEVEALFESDPMKLAGVQDYRFTEFRFHDGQPEVKGWFLSSEE